MRRYWPLNQQNTSLRVRRLLNFADYSGLLSQQCSFRWNKPFVSCHWPSTENIKTCALGTRLGNKSAIAVGSHSFGRLLRPVVAEAEHFLGGPSSSCFVPACALRLEANLSIWLYFDELRAYINIRKMVASAAIPGLILCFTSVRVGYLLSGAFLLPGTLKSVWTFTADNLHYLYWW